MKHKETLDSESESLLQLLGELKRVQENVVPGVRMVLVLLSSRAMPYDTESLRQKVIFAYPDAAVFFRTTSDKPLGQASPDKVDLLIDFTPPGFGVAFRQGPFFSKRLRRRA